MKKLLITVATLMALGAPAMPVTGSNEQMFGAE
jgi:hypothetical protein